MRCANPLFARGKSTIAQGFSTGVGVIDTGQLIAGHYRLAEHIGSGAMGVVWRAVDERLERSVAVKQIITQAGLSEDERVNVRQRAMREAKNAARFQHPNAIVVFDIAEYSGDPCLVMEYMPAHSLSALLTERGTLPIEDVAKIGEQVAAALVAAHRAGIVHRDIKPGNVLIDETGTTKITDFGISRAAGDMTLTQTGLIGGTPAYLAPELARGADPTPASDVFALGATLYHAIEGQPVYGDSSNQLGLLYAAASGKIIPPSQAGSATALLMSLLRAEPEDRPTMSEARNRLAALASGDGSVSGTKVSPPLPHGGPKPVAVPTAQATQADARPPWQRTEPAADGTPPRTATASPPPVQPHTAQQPAAVPAPNSQPPAPPRKKADSSGSGSGKRKPIVLGSIVAAVLVIATVVTIVLTSSGDDPGGQQAQSSNPPPPPSSTSQTPPTQAQSSGKVEWGPAGEFVGKFYDAPGSSASWQMLAAPVQEAYGSQQKFAAYWDSVKVEYWENAFAYKRQNNPDGSVDIRLDVITKNGPSQEIVRVIKTGGQLKIASDPRLGGSQQN